MTQPYRAMLTPCTGVCTIDPDGFCDGCHRTLDEIATWSSLDDETRRVLMDEVLPAREAART